METLCHRNQLEHLKIKLGFENLFVVDRVGRSGGLALFWKAKFKVRLLKYANNFIDMAIDGAGSGQWRLTGYYGYPESLEDASLGTSFDILLVVPLCHGFV